jgi:hypothetical protein
VTLRTDVSVLYVDPRGPYPKLVADWWGEDRDARLYAGPNPIVAHPPCGPWGSTAKWCKFQPKDCGPLAVEQVRKFGGVLEHPSGSKLWQHCGLPGPGAIADAWGGRTIEVCQVDWGHVARKRTWLYLVGVSSTGKMPPRGEPTHWVSGGRNRSAGKRGGLPPSHIKMCSAQQRRRSPLAFAEYLLSLAAQAKPVARSA